MTGGTRLLGSTSWQPHDAVAPPAAPSLLFKIKLLLVHLPPTTSPSLLFSPSLSHLHTSLTHQEKHHLVPSAPRPRDSSSRHSLPTASQHQQVSPTALALPLPFARVPNPCPAASLHLFRPSRTASEIWRYEAWGMQRAPACSLACSPALSRLLPHHHVTPPLFGFTQSQSCRSCHGYGTPSRDFSSIYVLGVCESRQLSVPHHINISCLISTPHIFNPDLYILRPHSLPIFS